MLVDEVVEQKLPSFYFFCFVFVKGFLWLSFKLGVKEVHERLRDSVANCRHILHYVVVYQIL
ncbi:hypothetical protein KC19_8G054900 [Ceratodon purpureus]|uniref:Uncharacterized protein n=1 Tax=Ceratodon purpureus TaxID=3225 RepID=A0A8T0H0Z3_CERPU|nr:hypothetical protein KC19_8G054900 [Ceratodon purpureus]